MTIDLAAITKRLPPHFEAKIDDGKIWFTTTHEGKPYELWVDEKSASDSVVGEFILASAIITCERFNEERGR